MNKMEQHILVYADWQELHRPLLMGCLHVQTTRGKEIFAFEFASNWLASPASSMLDPDLQLYSGRQYADPTKSNFGIFLDSSPDRWGRKLIMRREAIKARREARPARPLAESDYLLAVYDQTRMGALRFKLEEDGAFVSHDTELPVPPWTSLRELESAVRHYENDSLSNSEHDKWLSMLLAPGSSLGGARPKANVMDPDGHLWIAKFPSRGDANDIGAWEMVAYDLGLRFGLRLPECRLQRYSPHGSTFLTRRFDRNGQRRIHFASAMTLLGRMDGEDYSTGCSYLDLADFIVKYGAEPDLDLQELWRRVVFSIAVSNTDDHLRNHGFLLTPHGWRLSPAYDINPENSGGGLALNISLDDNSPDFDLALSVAGHFGVEHKRAHALVREAQRITATWRKTASKFNIPRGEIEEISPAFRQG